MTSYKKTFLTIGFFCIVILVFYLLNKKDKKAVYNKIKSDYFWGKIDTVFFDEENRMQPYAVLQGSGRKVEIGNNIYKEMVKGDTIYKEEGSFEFHLIKNGDTIIFYQQSGNKDIK